jgi:hypothetical protein
VILTVLAIIGAVSLVWALVAGTVWLIRNASGDEIADFFENIAFLELLSGVFDND